MFIPFLLNRLVLNIMKDDENKCGSKRIQIKCYNISQSITYSFTLIFLNFLIIMKEERKNTFFTHKTETDTT